MKKKISAFGLFLITMVTAFGQQVGIGTDTPDATAILELDVSDYAANNKKGFLPPRMTEAQRDAITSPAEGLVIYNLDEHCLEFWNDGEWVSFCNGTGGGGTPPVTPLNYRLGGSQADAARDIQKTSDGGYIIAGYNRSSASGDVSGINNGIQDYWIVKLNASLVIEWEKNYGGSDSDMAYSIQQTTDGGYIVAGLTGSSASGDVTGTNKGNSDYWILKLNASGGIVWQRNYGGSNDDRARSIKQTTDGGYIVLGETASSASGDVGTSKGNYDYWILKLNASGGIVWQRNYGGSDSDNAHSIQQTTDGGYIVAGTTTSSTSGDVTSVNIGGNDYWIVKLNASGNITWQKTYGGYSHDIPSSIRQTTDGGYIVGGRTMSSASGDVTGTNKGGYDAWIVKLNASGNITWQKNYGGSSTEQVHSIQQTTDGGYIFVGTTSSSASGDVTGVGKGNGDYWVVKLNATGSIMWQKNYGGSQLDEGYSIQQTTDGGYIVAGVSSNSSAGNGDQVGLISRGNTDYWILKLDSLGNITN